MPLLGGAVIGERGLYFRFKTAQAVLPPINGDLGLEAARANLLNAFEARPPRISINGVLLVSRETQVCLDIVKPIAVAVVDLQMMRRIHDAAVHPYVLPRATVADAGAGMGFA
jgi:hypothetical protein